MVGAALGTKFETICAQKLVGINDQLVMGDCGNLEWAKGQDKEGES